MPWRCVKLEIWLHSFLTLTRDGSEWPADTRPLYPRVKNIHYLINRMLVGPQNWSGSFGEGTIPCPCQESNPGPSSPYPSHYTKGYSSSLFSWGVPNKYFLNFSSLSARAACPPYLILFDLLKLSTSQSTNHDSPPFYMMRDYWQPVQLPNYLTSHSFNHRRWNLRCHGRVNKLWAKS
jgi:hypothetical protein